MTGFELFFRVFAYYVTPLLICFTVYKLQVVVNMSFVSLVTFMGNLLAVLLVTLFLTSL
jgi:hypothetical protein